MKGNERIKALLDALRGLRSHVSARLWSRRLRSYRPGSGADIEIDIVAGLSASIDKLAHMKSTEPARRVTPAVAHGIQPQMRGRSRRPLRLRQRPGAGSSERGNLARHFEAGHSAPSLHGETSEGLRKRTWEHIHAALRSAREGDTRKARLHAELANAGFAEARHHMTREEFTELAVRVREKLKQLI